MTTGSTRRRTVSLLVAALLGVGLGACRGGKTTDPAACMNECQQTCPFTPDAIGDNDDYIECLEACQTKCSG